MSAAATPSREAVLLARQPIVDAGLRLHGYELLFRTASGQGPSGVPHARATAHVLLGANLDIGLEQLVGSARAWINVSADLLEAVDLPLDPDRVILELLEDQAPTPDLVARLRALRRRGFSIALDDYVPDVRFEPLLVVADVVKIDVRQHGVAGAVRLVEPLRRWGVQLLAEKVEHPAEFRALAAAGFDLFQGWFFCRPEPITGRPVPVSAIAALGAAARLAAPSVTLEDLERTVSSDPGLALRLVRLINSAAFPRRTPVATVRQALMVLGTRAARQWALLIVLAAADPECEALLPTALLRAHAIAELAVRQGAGGDQGFVVGLLSVADALVGTSMAEVLADLPLAEEVTGALLHRRGPVGEALAAVLDHEAGRGASMATASAYAAAAARAEEHLAALAGS